MKWEVVSFTAEGGGFLLFVQWGEFKLERKRNQ